MAQSFFSPSLMKQDSWLYSDSFLKRAFAIWGYHFIANLIIMIPFMILWMIFAGIFIASFAGNPDFQRAIEDGMMQQDMQP
jgi:hypothetical protein